MTTKFTFNAKSVTVEAVSWQEFQITANIYNPVIIDIINSFLLTDTINNLHPTSLIDAGLLLKYCTLEDVFEQFDPVELKTRLAKYLINI